MNFKQLLEQAAGKVAEAKSIITEFEGKEMPAEKKSEMDNLLVEAANLKAQAESEKKAAEMDEYFNSPEYKHSIEEKGVKIMENNQTPEVKQDLAKKEAFYKFMREGKASLTREEKALVENQAGEILVPEDLQKEIFRDLPELTIVRNLASTRNTSSNRVRMRSINEVTVGWGKLETGATAPESTFVPTEEFQYVEDLVGLTKIGEDELDDSDINLNALVADSFSRVIAAAEDAAFIAGTGHANGQPEGILNNTAVGEVVSGAVGEIDIDDLKNLVYSVPAQYRKNGAFIMNSQTELALQKMKDNNGAYLWQPSVQAGRPATFLGYPVFNQEDVPAVATGNKAVIFGDFKAGYRILDRQDTSLTRLNELYAEQGLVGFKVKYRVGGAVVRPEAIKVLKVQ